MMIDDRKTPAEIRADMYIDTHLVSDSEFSDAQKALIELKKIELGLD